ncbi:MAG TPA: prepilin-type N-terminal cleavage/methylation domain-containing protein [Candidatus Didemnitutus sp.]
MPSGDGRRRFSDGFTLLELLVALAVTLLLAGLVLAVITRTIDGWRRASESAMLVVEANQLLDLLECDLQCVLRSRNATTWLTAQMCDDPDELRDRFGWNIDHPAIGRMKPPGVISLDAWSAVGPPAGRLTGARFGLGGCWLRFVALGSDGRPQAVAYGIGRRIIGGGLSGKPRYCLMRTAVPATLATGVDLAGGWAEELASPAATDLLATGVVDFGLWLGTLGDSSGSGLRRVYPRSGADLVPYGANGLTGSDYADRNPGYADVMVRLLTPEGERLLQEMEVGAGRLSAADDAEWWAMVMAHSMVFMRRVEFKSEGL